MIEQTANRDPKHLSELLVPDILKIRPTGKGNGKNYILIESLAANPGSTTMGPERELKQLHEFAKAMGITNLVYTGPTDEQNFAMIESVEQKTFKNVIKKGVKK